MPIRGPKTTLLPLPLASPGFLPRITPTDVSQFVRLEQCERFLRLRLSERVGQKFMEPYGVAVQRITPLMTLSGRSFEDAVEGELGGRFRSVHYAMKYGGSHDRPANNKEVLNEARGLKAGEAVLLFQTRLEVEIGGWLIRGDVLFKARLFDYLGKLNIDGATEGYTRRARFGSTIPLEYAYAAWGQLPKPAKGHGDAFADFRPVTKDLLVAFQKRRLEAMEHVASRIPGNPNTQKTAFTLPDIVRYADKAHDLAQALDEFVRIERRRTG